MKRVIVNPVLTSAHSASIAVAGAVTVYTKAQKLAFGEYFSVAYKAYSSAGSVDVKIEMELSVNGELPATEGASDTNYVQPDDMADIEASLTTETWHIKTLSPCAAVYGRFKITGAAGNNADTVVSMNIQQSEDL